ncbi:multiple sugar transport system permease protein [Motilibacter peucedani]|uniref:Multiple sugar transport system permease protein n=1 Tax=Motilibacter peucedani TaxID=598650 RepID=A0A420XUF2_9ACTN|nr:sugar ABC transporter permease [Motilibacter peucedani]RKS80466.1 multiple sugar transport system permease protein [Motilibacter peucedani]
MSVAHPRADASQSRRAVARALPLAPATLLLLVFLAGPIVWSVYGAFTNTALSGAGAANSHFIGLDNFHKAFDSSAFRNSVVLTLVFTFLSAIVGQNLVGLCLALLMRAGSKVVRTLVGAFVVGAWVIPEVVAGYIWYAFLGKDGSLNAFFDSVGLGHQALLFSHPIVAVSIANIWRGTAFSMLVYSAALSEVPRELEEAAEVDGASGARRLWSVTLPLIRRSVTTNLMLITLQTLSVFGLIYTMTKGGPGTKSQTLPLYMYEQAFSFGQLGYGTALALVMLVVGAVFSLVYLRVLKTEI